jgi:hypothetical protein
MTGGVVLPGNTYGEDSFRGIDVAIVIASLTHYPLEPSCLNTHTHTSSNISVNMVGISSRTLSENDANIQNQIFKSVKVFLATLKDSSLIQ